MAFFSSSCNFLFFKLIRISLGSFLFKKQSVFKPFVSIAGISFKACTAISIFFSISSFSIFVENNPLPPKSDNLLS